MWWHGPGPLLPVIAPFPRHGGIKKQIRAGTNAGTYLRHKTYGWLLLLLLCCFVLLCFVLGRARVEVRARVKVQARDGARGAGTGWGTGGREASVVDAQWDVASQCLQSSLAELCERCFQSLADIRGTPALQKDRARAPKPIAATPADVHPSRAPLSAAAARWLLVLMLSSLWSLVLPLSLLFSDIVKK